MPVAAKGPAGRAGRVRGWARGWVAVVVAGLGSAGRAAKGSAARGLVATARSRCCGAQVNTRAANDTRAISSAATQRLLRGEA